MPGRGSYIIAGMLCALLAAFDLVCFFQTFFDGYIFMLAGKLPQSNVPFTIMSIFLDILGVQALTAAGASFLMKRDGAGGAALAVKFILYAIGQTVSLCLGISNAATLSTFMQKFGIRILLIAVLIAAIGIFIASITGKKRSMVRIAIAAAVTLAYLLEEGIPLLRELREVSMNVFLLELMLICLLTVAVIIIPILTSELHKEVT